MHPGKLRGAACERYMRVMASNNRMFLVSNLVLALVFVAGCRTQPGALSPNSMARVEMETVREWAAEIAPPQATRYDMRWTFQTQRGAVRGQAALRVEPPDSLRFDYRGPFGRAGAAFIVDNELVWAEPEEDVETLIQAVPLFWAALGLPRDPPVGTEIFGIETAEGRSWRYGVGSDTMEYHVVRAPRVRFLAEMRQIDEVLGRVEVNYDDETSLPTRATLTFPKTASLFVLDVTKIDTTVALNADVWKRP